MIILADQKLSISLSEIHDEITHKGFEVTRVKYDKKTDRYLATAKKEDIEIEAHGKSEKLALANLLNNVAYEHAKGIQRLARWKTTFESQLQQIAEAYSKAAAYEKKAATAFMELANECEARAEVIKKHLQIITNNNPEAYPSPDKMYDDIRKHRKLEVSLVAADQHPLWTKEQVLDYRICLDVLGFAAVNGDWGWEGTNQAFAAFAALLPELAQEALFSELVGQTAYATYYRAYGPAKICLLTKFIEKAMKEENPHNGYRGIHPSQMLLPSETPEAKKTAGIAADAEMVPVNWLKQYREYDRSPGNGPEGYAQTKPEYWNKLKNHIQQNGFEDPLTLEYDPDKGTGYLGEGNHRLGIAEELGMTHVPVHVYQSRDRGNGAHPYQKISEPGQYLDERGYFPQSTKPSAIGIPVSENPYTPASSNWYKDAYPERNNPATTPISPTGYVPQHLQQPKKPDGSHPITGKKIKPSENGTIPFDINDGYSTTLENIPSVHYPTEYPDFLNLRGAGDVLDGLHTDWADKIHDSSDESHVRQEWRMYKQDDPEGALKIQHAVANAIKGALLLEDNTLGHGAIQYQSLLHKVSDDPEELMSGLNSARSEWNSERFGDHTAEEHRPWTQFNPKTGQMPISTLASLLYEKNPHMSPIDAHKEAQRMIHQMLSRFHEQVKDEENTDNMPKDEAGWHTEQKATEKLIKWLDTVTNGSGKLDHFTVTSAKKVDPIKPHKYNPSYDSFDNHRVFNLQRYPAVHGKHVQTISKLIKDLDRIVEEALVDVHNHDGKGHHFRAFIMSLVDINPKTVGVMWLLLAPYTSQLSMIDEEMTGALGHHASGKAPRDYFLHERELMAHRDGMGLSHIPLGHFNLALNGANLDGAKQASSGPHHQDLSALRVDNPTPAWKVKLTKPHGLLYNFSLTPEVVKPIQEQWNNTVATQFAPDETPTKTVRPSFMPIAKVGSKMQEYRNLGMSVEDVWNQIDDPNIDPNLAKIAEKKDKEDDPEEPEYYDQETHDMPGGGEITYFTDKKENVK